MRSRTAVSFGVLLTVVLPASHAAWQGSPAKTANVVSVTLTKRVDDGAYGTSAYSIRYASQDFEVHKNDVDIVYGACGFLHIAPLTGMKNRIIKVGGSTLADATTMPAATMKGWKVESIKPEAGAVYVMEIDDGSTHMRVGLHITSLSEKELTFEWAPFREAIQSASGTMAPCPGKHATK